MKCSKCSTENSDNAKFCVTCGQNLFNNEQVRETPPTIIPKYSAVSAVFCIIVSVCCCVGWYAIVFAIISLIEGSNVKNLVAMGKYSEAQAKLKEADKWSKVGWIINIASIVIVLAVLVFYIVMMMVVFGIYGLNSLYELNALNTIN